MHLPSLWSRADSNAVPLRSLHEEINKIFEDFNRGFGMPAMSGADGTAVSTLSPNMDVVETDKSIELTAELPGVAEDEVDVTLVDDVLTIKGEKKAEKTDEKQDYRVVERTYGSFQRSMRLPFKVDAEAIEAQFTNGVLKVSLPKPPEVEAQTKKISVKSS